MEIKSTEESMDGFINYIITIIGDVEHLIEHTNSSALLVIHTLLRPLQPLESRKQNDALSLRKIWGEGKLVEQNIYLGWDIRTHSLRVILPKKNQTAWATNIQEALSSTKLKADTLE